MLSVKGKHPSWKWSYVRSMNRSWNKHLPKVCQVCGYDIHVELAHIHPMSNFPETTILSVVNDPRNNLVLCRNHHWEFDKGIRPLDEIPRRPHDDAGRRGWDPVKGYED